MTSPFDGELASRDAWTVNPELHSFHDPHVAVRFCVFVNDVHYYCDSVVQPFCVFSHSTELSLSDVRM